MKLVAAKCPNCGANIEVDKKIDSTVCEYCKSKIIVDDAIAKYKLEIQIKNMPSLENYLKLGRRYFLDKDYEEAHNIYSKALELDPDNIESIFYKGITKSLCTTYRDFDVYSALQSTKMSIELSDDKNMIDKYILNLNIAISKLETFAIDFYNNNNLSYYRLEDYLEKLKDCLMVYEYCFKNICLDENKIIILNKIIKLIKYILKRKVYRNNEYKKEIYYMPFEDKKELIKKLKKYKEELYKLDPNKKIKEEEIIKNKITLIIYIVVEIIMFILFVSSIINTPNIIWSIIFLLDFILILPFISNKIFKSSKIGYFFKTLLVFIGILGFSINRYPEFVNYTYSSDTIDLVLEFNKDKVRINNKLTDYNYKNENTYIVIKIENYIFKYRKSDSQYLFCMLENDDCVHYFTSNYIKHNYIKK